MSTYLIIDPEGVVIATPRRNAKDLARAVMELEDLGYTEGTIDNQDGGTANLRE